MQVITNWKEILALDSNINQELVEEIKDYFQSFVTEQLEEDYKKYDMAEIGRIAILEACDNINHLPQIFLTQETGTLLEAIPEYIECIAIGEEKAWRIIFIFGDCFGVVLYVLDSLVNEKLKEWLEKYHEK